MAHWCEIEESIASSANSKHHIVLYYPKYYCELNHIEHFWCNAKKWARENCQYSLDDLCRRVSLALASVPNHIILAYYYCCQNKIKLYQEGIKYGSSQWKAHTAHHKPTNKDEDQWLNEGCWHSGARWEGGVDKWRNCGMGSIFKLVITIYG